MATPYSIDIGNGVLTTIPVNHVLGTRDVQVEVWETASPYGTVRCDVERPSVDQVNLIFAVAPTNNQYRVMVMA